MTAMIASVAFGAMSIALFAYDRLSKLEARVRELERKEDPPSA